MAGQAPLLNCNNNRIVSQVAGQNLENLENVQGNFAGTGGISESYWTNTSTVQCTVARYFRCYIWYLVGAGR